MKTSAAIAIVVALAIGLVPGSASLARALGSVRQQPAAPAGTSKPATSTGTAKPATATATAKPATSAPAMAPDALDKLLAPIALYPDHGTDPTALMKSADLAMYAAKDKGRANVQFARPVPTTSSPPPPVD